ncbi:hypothetical protein SAMN02745150_00369 [Brevinema andersonii]|uniref:Uncharacterized protein n=1 Tax=Brevinema andersonii TaxID=34097 RepID=A0A1I1D8J2_BREAD|nr:hypothetical protein [Brevinema andersonii]SFB70656.1 hypothetical protein SAMN02745150_00369 [Brevinema andersonii]
MRFLFIFLVVPVLGFSQSQLFENYLERSVDSPGKIGTQVSSTLTGVKGTRPNDVFDLNILLYQRTNYYIPDDEVIGVIKGRLTTEFALSSFDRIAELQKNPEINISNYGSEFIKYYEEVSNYTLFQQIFDETLKKTLEEYTQDQNQNTSDENTNSITDNIEENYQEYIEYNPENYNYTSLHYMEPKIVAEQIEVMKVESIPEFPSIAEVFANSKASLTAEELQILANYEELYRAYSNTIVIYNKILEAQEAAYNPQFDPADPKETFTIMLSGEKTRHFWSSEIKLDGEKNYQSFDEIVWYLGYELPLTKKDLRALVDLFENNDRIEYYIKGSGGELRFQLSDGLTRGFKILLDAYARGKFISTPDPISPLFR